MNSLLGSGKALQPALSKTTILSVAGKTSLKHMSKNIGLKFNDPKVVAHFQSYLYVSFMAERIREGPSLVAHFILIIQK